MIDQKAQLPSFIIAELFKNSLVEMENNISSVSKKGEVFSQLIRNDYRLNIDNEQIYLGNNSKFVSVVLAENSAKYINDDDLVFLTNILKACKLSIDDIAILNIARNPLTYISIKETLEAKFILVFGIEPSEIKLPFVIPHFQVQQYAGCTFVIAPSLNEINKEGEIGKMLKTKLWLSLQRCFNLS